MDIFDSIDIKNRNIKIEKIKKKYNNDLNFLYYKSQFNEIMNFKDFILLSYLTYYEKDNNHEIIY